MKQTTLKIPKVQINIDELDIEEIFRYIEPKFEANDWRLLSIHEISYEICEYFALKLGKNYAKHVCYFRPIIDLLIDLELIELGCKYFYKISK